MQAYLLLQADLLTLDPAKTIIRNGYLAILDGSILALGQMSELDPRRFIGFEELDCGTGYKRKVVLPGFIQTHVHTAQALGRGLGDDVDLQTWTRERIWPYEAALTEEDVYVSATLSIAEMIKSGTTCFCEASGEQPDAIANAILDTGMRGIVCQSTMDVPGEFPACMYMPTEKAARVNFDLVERWHGKNDRVDACLELLNMFNTSETLWKTFTEYSQKHNVLVQAHIAEAQSEIDFTKEVYGLSTVKLLEKWGCLTPELLAAHVVFVDDAELTLLCRRDVKVMHMPAADLRIAGLARIPEMLRGGISVSLGTNSPPCSNRMSIMDEMWLASIMHKSLSGDLTAMSAATVLEMATTNGARALHREESLGSLEVGKKADITVMDMNTLCSTPTYNLESTIVYQATSNAVDTVFIDGKPVLRNGRLTTIDEGWLLREAERRAEAIVRRAGIRY